jgi:aminomethyltransferase
VFAGDTQVGVVTSGGFAPSVGAPIAMATVETAHAADGMPLEIEVRGRRLMASVVPMPFKPKNYVREGASA